MHLMNSNKMQLILARNSLIMILLVAIISYASSLGFSINKKPFCLYVKLAEHETGIIKYLPDNDNVEVLLFDPFNM